MGLAWDRFEFNAGCSLTVVLRPALLLHPVVTDATATINKRYRRFIVMTEFELSCITSNVWQ